VVQDLIRIKKEMKVIGGLPNMPLVKRVTDERGISIGGTKKVKRVQHGVRPIEYYTNLDSVTRMLQYKYVKMLFDSGKDIDLGVRDSEAKKEFFSRMKKENSWISGKLDAVKFDEELYRIYLQERLIQIQSPMALKINGEVPSQPLKTFAESILNFINTLPEQLRNDFLNTYEPSFRTRLNNAVTDDTLIVDFIEEFKSKYKIDPLTGLAI
jgi:hypothetical protein